VNEHGGGGDSIAKIRGGIRWRRSVMTVMRARAIVPQIGAQLAAVTVTVFASPPSPPPLPSPSPSPG